MYAYTENNPVKYVDPTGYQLADPTKENDGVEPLRPDWSSPYDYYYNDWYVHPKYTNMNLYSEIIYENLNYSEYNGPSYFWWYVGTGVAGIVIEVVGVINPSTVILTVAGIAITAGSTGMVVYEQLRGDPDVYTVSIRYNEKHDMTRAYFRFYETYIDDDYMGIQYRYVGFMECFFDGRASTGKVNDLIDKYE